MKRRLIALAIALALSGGVVLSPSVASTIADAMLSMLISHSEASQGWIPDRASSWHVGCIHSAPIYCGVSCHSNVAHRRRNSYV